VEGLRRDIISTRLIITQRNLIFDSTVHWMTRFMWCCWLFRLSIWRSRRIWSRCSGCWSSWAWSIDLSRLLFWPRLINYSK
jgi:hypothetical protein